MKHVSIPEMLQMDFNVAIASAKIAEFENQAYLAGDMVRMGLLRRADAADLLHEAAIYNSLIPLRPGVLATWGIAALRWRGSDGEARG